MLAGGVRVNRIRIKESFNHIRVSHIVVVVIINVVVVDVVGMSAIVPVVGVNIHVRSISCWFSLPLFILRVSKELDFISTSSFSISKCFS